MSKRKVEQQPLGTLLPPCKRRVWEPQPLSRHCTPDTLRSAPRRKRELEPKSASSIEVVSSCECDRLEPADSPAASSPSPPCKKLRVSESYDDAAAAQFKSQKDEAFWEFNSSQYWRDPLPDVDFSELEVESCGDDRPLNRLEEMDS